MSAPLYLRNVSTLLAVALMVNFLLQFAVLLSLAAFASAGIVAPLGGASVSSRQQDDFGNYAFNYQTADAFGATNGRFEAGNGHGGVVGSYNIADIDGRARRVDYVADAAGFRAKVHTNEPGTAASLPAAAVVASPYAAPVAPVAHAPVVAKAAVAAPFYAAAAAPVAAAVAAPAVYGAGFYGPAGLYGAGIHHAGLHHAGLAYGHGLGYAKTLHF